MLDGMEETLLPTVDRWLADFEQAISGPDFDALAGLIHEDGHWRDLLAFTWHIQTVSGAGNIVDALKGYAPSAKASGFHTNLHRTPPRVVTRAGREAVEAIFSFETACGPGSGVVRLIRDEDDQRTPRAWTLMTALDGIDGFEESVGTARPTGEVYAARFQRTQLARRTTVRRLLHRPGSGGAGRRRRPGRNCRSPLASDNGMSMRSSSTVENVSGTIGATATTR